MGSQAKNVPLKEGHTYTFGRQSCVTDYIRRSLEFVAEAETG